MNLFRVMMKDLRLLSRDRSALVFLLLVPMVVIFVIAETQSESGSKSILFPIVNEDQGPVANALIKVFREHLDVRIMDRPSAEQLVKVENKAPAILVLPAGHEQALPHRAGVDHRAADRSGAVEANCRRSRSSCCWRIATRRRWVIRFTKSC